MRANWKERPVDFAKVVGGNGSLTLGQVPGNGYGRLPVAFRARSGHRHFDQNCRGSLFGRDRADPRRHSAVLAAGRRRLGCRLPCGDRYRAGRRICRFAGGQCDRWRGAPAAGVCFIRRNRGDGFHSFGHLRVPIVTASARRVLQGLYIDLRHVHHCGHLDWRPLDDFPITCWLRPEAGIHRAPKQRRFSCLTRLRKTTPRKPRHPTP